MTTRLTIRKPDDWHLHVRDGAMLKAVMPHTARHFGRAILMPNLIPPVRTTADAIAYRARGETFFLRRLRVVEDVVAIPTGTHVDDAVSATLNYADGLWSPRDGALHTFVVRRRHAPNEGPDEVATGYRAELAPLEARVAPDPENGKSSALFDLSPFSSWMRPSRPARIVFGINRRPELITSSMILGSSVTIRLGAV